MSERSRVEEVVRGLARTDKKKFHATYVAQQAGVDVAEARAALLDLEKEGVVQVHLDLTRPSDHRTVASFSIGDTIPEWFEDEESDEGGFYVEPGLLWLTFSPTQGFRRGVLASEPKESAEGKASRPRRPFRPRADKGPRSHSMQTPWLPTSLRAFRSH